MPERIDNITDAAHQQHTILFEESEVVLTLRFLPTVPMWALDWTYKTRTGFGYRLAVDTLLMRSRNLPFDFVVVDASGLGLDPRRKDDFSTGRCELYMLNADDMELLRDAPVPI